MNREQQQRLAALVTHPVAWQCRLDRYTSFAIGGPAEAVVTVDDSAELPPLLHFLVAEAIPWRILGRGTNVLVRDEGFGGVVLLLGRDFRRIIPSQDQEGNPVILAGSACSLTRLITQAAELGFAGLEFAYGIPGTVGGAVLMNAGAWGREIGAIIADVTITTAEGEFTLGGTALGFAYRCCPGFQQYRGRAVISAVSLLLARGEPAEILAACRSFMERRRATQPSGQPNAGSFFKNPPGDSAGRLIEASGCKGLRIGGAMVSPRHANFLVNAGGAKAVDVLELMRVVQDRVEAETGIILEPEVHFFWCMRPGE